jgi:hypothetical protein
VDLDSLTGDEQVLSHRPLQVDAAPRADNAPTDRALDGDRLAPHVEVAADDAALQDAHLVEEPVQVAAQLAGDDRRLAREEQVAPHDALQANPAARREGVAMPGAQDLDRLARGEQVADRALDDHGTIRTEGGVAVLVLGGDARLVVGALLARVEGLPLRIALRRGVGAGAGGDDQRDEGEQCVGSHGRSPVLDRRTVAASAATLRYRPVSGRRIVRTVENGPRTAGTYQPSSPRSSRARRRETAMASSSGARRRAR